MAISKEKIKNITAEDVLQYTTDYDVFRYYIGEFVVGRKFKNPLYKDSNAGCIIRMVDGKLMLRDYGDDSWNGDCFSLVKRLYNCNFGEALKQIDGDMNLGLFNGTTERNRIITFNKPKIREHKPPKIFTETTHIHPVGREYLAQYHLTLKDMNFCKDTTVRYVNELVINYKRESIGKLAIEYELKNERGKWKKIYRPYGHKDKKWYSNIPFIEMHGVGNIDGCKIGILTGSLKEGAWISRYISPCVEVVQAEDYWCISEQNKKRLKEKCGELYIAFNSDDKGVKSCTRLQKELNCKYINPPKELLSKGIKDFTDWCKATDNQTVIDFWKLKGVI